MDSKSWVNNSNQIAWRSSRRLPNEKQIPTLTETPLQNGSHRQPLQTLKKMILLSMILSKTSAFPDTMLKIFFKFPAFFRTKFD
jgi:hypothetical protein